MRFLQLNSKARLAGGDTSECEEAVLEVVRQKGTVPQVLNRLSLGVQHGFYSLDDVIATSQEEIEELDMGLKLHQAGAFLSWLRFVDEQACGRHSPARSERRRIARCY
jgi:hypothetical protein